VPEPEQQTKELKAETLPPITENHEYKSVVLGNKPLMEEPKKDLKPEVKPKHDNKILDVAKLSLKDQAPATVKESPEPKESLKDTEEGFFLKTISGNPMIPSEEVARSETSLVKKEPGKEKLIARKGDIEELSLEKKKPPELPVVKESKKEQPSVTKMEEKGKAPVLEKSSSDIDKSLSLDDFSFNMMEPFDEIFEKLQEKSIANKAKETELAKKEANPKEPGTKISGMKEFPSTERSQGSVKPETEMPASQSPVLPGTDAGLILKPTSDKMIMPYGLKKIEEMQNITIDETLTPAEEKTASEKTKEGDTPPEPFPGLEAKELTPIPELNNTYTEELPAIKEKDTGVTTGVTPKAGEHRDLKKTREEGESLVEEILTPDKNRMPSREEYLQNLDEKNNQITSEIKPETREEEIRKEERIPFGIPVPDILLSKDIKIEVILDNAEAPDVSFNLLSNTHPMDKKRNEPEKYNKLDTNEEREETDIGGAVRLKRIFSIEKADRKTYIFEISNKGPNSYEADILFRLFEGKKGGRIKEYKTVKILPNLTLRYKFILPEAVFWDDEYYFTGKIESSNSITKFNDKTGLIWKENKDY
jgi:hypothetical protein